MFDGIKNKIEKSLVRYASGLDATYRLRDISPLIGSLIREFITRPGKRVRPVLFAASYLAYARTERPGLYTSCLSIELLHDFMLIHDDIIDRSDTRRGKPSLHARLNAYLRHRPCKFTGQDLSIVIGDVLYAMAVHAFLAIDEEPRRKEKALKRFIEAALCTGSGEFIELLSGTRPFARITERDIYKIYDYKTAFYTFACPLSIGAILAGAPEKDVQRLFDFGIYLGRAFQIKDDMIGMFSDEKEIGKSNLTDIQEAKKTLLIRAAYRNSRPADRKRIERILAKETATRRDLDEIRSLIVAAGADRYAKKEAGSFADKAGMLLERCSMPSKFKKELAAYTGLILKM